MYLDRSVIDYDAEDRFPDRQQFRSEQADPHQTKRQDLTLQHRTTGEQENQAEPER